MDGNTTKRLHVLQAKLCDVLFDEIRDIVILTTEAHRIVKTNYSASVLFGFSGGSIIGRHIDMLLDPESRIRSKAITAALHIDGETANTMLSAVDYVGYKRDFSATIRYFSSHEGIRQGHLLYIMRRAINPAKDSLYEINSALTIRRLLKGFADSVLLIDYRNRTICDCNLAAETMFGYSRDELIGRSPQFLAPNQTLAKKYMENSRSNYASTGFSQGKMLCRKKDGSHFMTLATNISMFNDYGDLQYVVAINRDITKEEKILDDIIRYTEQSKHLLQVLYESILPLKASDSSISLSDLGFSNRQIAIVAVLLTGETTKKIAGKLNISESAVKNHLSIMYRRTKVSSKVEFVKYLHDRQIRIE